MRSNDCITARGIISGCKEKNASLWRRSTTGALPWEAGGSLSMEIFKKLNLYCNLGLISQTKNSNWSWYNLWRKAVDTCPISAATDIFVCYPSLLFCTTLQGSMDASVYLQTEPLLNPASWVKCFACFSLFCVSAYAERVTQVWAKHISNIPVKTVSYAWPPGHKHRSTNK